MLKAGCRAQRLHTDHYGAGNDLARAFVANSELQTYGDAAVLAASTLAGWNARGQSLAPLPLPLTSATRAAEHRFWDCPAFNALLLSQRPLGASTISRTRQIRASGSGSRPRSRSDELRSQRPC